MMGRGVGSSVLRPLQLRLVPGAIPGPLRYQLFRLGLLPRASGLLGQVLCWMMGRHPKCTDLQVLWTAQLMEKDQGVCRLGG